MGDVTGDRRVFAFWSWKWKAVEKRKERGLKVSENVIWPTIEQWKQWKEYAAKSDAKQEDCSALEQWIQTSSK